jgi:hypothetical protein
MSFALRRANGTERSALICVQNRGRHPVAKSDFPDFLGGGTLANLLNLPGSPTLGGVARHLRHLLQQDSNCRGKA